MTDIDPNDPSFYRNMSHNQLSRLWMEHEDQKAYDELELRMSDFYGHDQPEHQGTTDWHESEGGLAHLIEEAYKGNQPQAPAEVIQSRDEHYLNQPYYPPEIMGEMYAEETGKNPFKKPIGHTINRKPEVRLPIMTPLKDESGYTQWQQKNASEDTVFDQAWSIAKDFYFGQKHPHEEGGFHQRWPPEVYAGPEGSHNVRSKEGKGGPYWSAANLAHPIFQYEDWLPPEGIDADFHIPRQRIDEDEMIRRIINTLVHEEGHEAILNPLEAEAYEDWNNTDDGYFSNFQPSNQVQEHGAMLIEGLSNPEIRAEMQRRGFFS